MTGRSRKWSTGAKKLLPRIVERSSSTRACACTRVGEDVCVCPSDSDPLDRRNLRRRRRRWQRCVALLRSPCPVHVTSLLFPIEENCGTHIRTFLRARSPTSISRGVRLCHPAILNVMRDDSDNFNWRSNVFHYRVIISSESLVAIYFSRESLVRIAAILCRKVLLSFSLLYRL